MSSTFKLVLSMDEAGHVLALHTADAGPGLLPVPLSAAGARALVFYTRSRVEKVSYTDAVESQRVLYTHYTPSFKHDLVSKSVFYIL